MKILFKSMLVAVAVAATMSSAAAAPKVKTPAVSSAHGSSGAGSATGFACGGSNLSASGMGFLSCAGFYSGNLNNTASASMVAADLLTNFNFASNGSILDHASVSGNTITFAHALTGINIIGVHVGGTPIRNGGTGTQSTAFYKFDAGSIGISKFTFNLAGLSNVSLYERGVPPVSSVPETETVAMLLAGLGMIGMIRRRQSSK